MFIANITIDYLDYLDSIKNILILFCQSFYNP